MDGNLQNMKIIDDLMIAMGSVSFLELLREQSPDQSKKSIPRLSSRPYF